MLDIARTLPNGDHANIRWIYGPVETVELNPPYGLITAGASLHWMEWSLVMPRFRRLLAPGGVVALVGGTSIGDAPWLQELLPIIQHYSTNHDFQPYNTVDELTARGLFTVLGRATTDPVPLCQSVADYVASFHARNGFSRDRMQPEMAGVLRRGSHRDFDALRGSGKIALALSRYFGVGRTGPGCVVFRGGNSSVVLAAGFAAKYLSSWAMNPSKNCGRTCAQLH